MDSELYQCYSEIYQLLDNHFRELANRLSRIETNQERILYKLAVLFEIQRKAKGELDHMAIDLGNIQATVTKAETVEESATALIQGVSAQLKQLADTLAADSAAQQQINDLATALDAKTQALSAAVTANTPAAPPTA